MGGLLLGLAASLTGSPLLTGVAEGVEPLGTAFVDLLKMVVLPLVASVVFVGVASLGDLKKLGRMGAVTMGYITVTAVVGALWGMGVMRALLPLASEAAVDAATATGMDAPVLPGPVQFLLELIPANPFQAAAEGQLLPLILFVILLAAATGTLPPEQRDRLNGVAESLASALIKLVDWILWVAPLGVFALAAPVTARAGWALLQSLLAFVLAVLLGLVVFVGVVLLPTVRFLARVPPGAFLKACISPQVIAAASVSSPATVPAMLEAAEEMDVPEGVAGFVISLGAGLSRAGSAVFQGASVVFLAWLYGVPLPAVAVAGATLAILIVSLTIPSIPGGSVLSMAPAFGTIGIPLDGLAVLLSIDRIPDMARTATNVTSTMVATVVVGRLESSSGDEGNPRPSSSDGSIPPYPEKREEVP